MSTPPVPTRPDVTHRLLIALRLAILAFSVILVIVAIPNYFNRQHILSVYGVNVRQTAGGEMVFTRVVSGTPSAQAGIVVSDVLVAINGQPVDSHTTLAQLNDEVSGWVNTPVTVTVRTGAAAPRDAVIIRAPDANSVAGRLAALDLGMDFLINYMIFFDVLVMLVYLVVAVVLIMRGQTTRLLYFASITLLMFGVSSTNSVQWLSRESSVWGALAGIYTSIGFAAAFTFLGFLYPDGRWVPRKGRILVALVWVWTVLQWVWPEARPANWDPIVTIFVYLMMVIAMFIAQVRRYRHLATPAQRQQIKAFVLALASVVAGYALSQIAGIIVYFLGFVLTRASAVVVLIVWQISVLGYQVPYMLLAIAIGLALLRHRLWDIDLVINQSLVYSILTATLAIVFAVVLAMANTLIGQVFGSASPFLVAAVTTAFPVALFNPLRGRIQKLVDSRLKPEEVSFTELCALLALEVQALLPSKELLITLAHGVAGQLTLTSVAAYMVDPDRRLTLVHTVTSDDALQFTPAPELELSEAVRDKLERGHPVTPPEDSGLAWLVPLTTISVHTPELCAVLALGLRKDHKGFSTPTEAGLRALGREAGKSLYVAQRRERAGK